MAKQITDKSSNSFGANMENNAKEECKVVMTRSKNFVEVELEKKLRDKVYLGLLVVLWLGMLVFFLCGE